MSSLTTFELTDSVLYTTLFCEVKADGAIEHDALRRVIDTRFEAFCRAYVLPAPIADHTEKLVFRFTIELGPIHLYRLLAIIHAFDFFKGQFETIYKVGYNVRCQLNTGFDEDLPPSTSAHHPYYPEDAPLFPIDPDFSEDTP